MQSLALNKWPLSEFEQILPGEGYRDEERSLRLLTQECEGEYTLATFEENVKVSGEFFSQVALIPLEESVSGSRDLAHAVLIPVCGCYKERGNLRI